MAASYTKLRSGAWGIRSDRAVKVGDSVAVRTKAGASKVVTQVVWTDGAAWLCAIEQRSSRSGAASHGGGAARPSGGSRPGGRRTGCSCGSREDSSGSLIPSPRNCAQCRYDDE